MKTYGHSKFEQHSRSIFFQLRIVLEHFWNSSYIKKVNTWYGTTSKLNSPIRDVKSPLREAPPVLELEEHEKFCDDEGNVYEVEVRGVREEDKIYFKGADVQKVFEMENLVKNIKRDHTNLEDYEQFSLIMVYSRLYLILVVELVKSSVNGLLRSYIQLI